MYVIIVLVIFMIPSHYNVPSEARYAEAEKPKQSCSSHFVGDKEETRAAAGG